METIYVSPVLFFSQMWETMSLKQRDDYPKFSLVISSGHKEGGHNEGRHNGVFKATGNILYIKLRGGYMVALSYYIVVIYTFHVYYVNIYRLWARLPGINNFQHNTF